MNVKDYISSGIIESYVLGLASPEERREFEDMCANHPEVLHARTAFEITLEQQAMATAITPQAELKENIFEAIRSTTTVAPVVKMQPRSNGLLKFAAAACLLLLAGSVYWNYTLQQKNDGLQEALLRSKNELVQSQNEMAQVKEDMKVMQNNPSVKMARLDGQAISPNSMATVYWDTTSHDVYLLVNNLPKPASTEQYQLWALLDGKPMDMGMLEISEKPLQMYRMKNAQGAQAFAITLEKKGGSPSPTLEKMYVMGKL